MEEELICINIEPLVGNNIAPPLVKGRKYPVKEVFTCKCGQNHFDVGLLSQHNFISCYSCGDHIPRGDTIHWCHPNRFKNEENENSISSGEIPSSIPS